MNAPPSIVVFLKFGINNINGREINKANQLTFNLAKKGFPLSSSVGKNAFGNLIG